MVRSYCFQDGWKGGFPRARGVALVVLLKISLTKSPPGIHGVARGRESFCQSPAGLAVELTERLSCSRLISGRQDLLESDVASKLSDARFRRLCAQCPRLLHPPQHQTPPLRLLAVPEKPQLPWHPARIPCRDYLIVSRYQMINHLFEAG